MANKTYEEMGFKIDGAAGTIVDITSYVNGQSLAAALNLLEDSALGDEERTYLPGMAGATISLNGYVNSTTDGIFGPLVGNQTSITKTVNYMQHTGRHYTGEVFPNNVQFSGAKDELNVWSADLTFSGAVTRTSIPAS